MTQRKIIASKTGGHRIIQALILCLFGLCVVASVVAQVSTNCKPKVDDDRVYLVHADELMYDQTSQGFSPRNQQESPQILKGHVHFIHQGADMWCDSAYFFQNDNAMKAYGHVKFVQGDTLALTCDYADYNGQSQIMQARYNVVLSHRQQTLYTDSLNFDRLYSDAYFFEGGKLVDGTDSLVSDWGRYNTVSRQAMFVYNVNMHSDGQNILTDTLYYDTQNSMAHVKGPSTITSKTSVIKTNDAYLNTETDLSELYGRSTIVDKEKTITGDSLYHNNQTGDNEGYGNVVYTDTLNKNQLTANKLFYNNLTGYGWATDSVLLKEFSQGDTLYVHSDSLKIYTYNIDTDSVYRKVHAFNKVRAFRSDVQAVSDSIVFNSADSCMTMYRDPIVWNVNRQILGEVIKVYMNDSTIRMASVIGQALAIEQVDFENHYNQISSRRMDAYFTDGVVRRVTSQGNVKSVYYRIEEKDSSIVGLNYLETDTMRMFMSPERKLQKIWASKSVATMYPITQVPPEKYKLKEFAWFDNVRPTSKDDIFVWRGKGAGNELKVLPRQEAPLQKLGRKLATQQQPEPQPGQQQANNDNQPPQKTEENGSAQQQQQQ